MFPLCNPWITACKPSADSLLKEIESVEQENAEMSLFDLIRILVQPSYDVSKNNTKNGCKYAWLTSRMYNIFDEEDFLPLA